jgi:hypothetical protein
MPFHQNISSELKNLTCLFFSNYINMHCRLIVFFVRKGRVKVMFPRKKLRFRSSRRTFPKFPVANLDQIAKLFACARNKNKDKVEYSNVIILGEGSTPQPVSVIQIH